MSLRGRLVLSLVAMLAVGMFVYGFATFRAFARAEVARLDDDLRTAVDLVRRELAVERLPGRGDGPRGGPGGPALLLAPGTYAELRSPAGTVLGSVQFGEGGAVPDLTGLSVGAPDGTRTVTSVDGDGRWRVLTETVAAGRQLVVAAPMTGVERSLGRLLAIELAAGLALLLLLGAGAWLILRRGLRPLERIARTASSITAGDLGRRVEVEEPRSEVGQLAAALNGMLDHLELAFHEREASEARLRRFLADASHELRTPLTSIQGFAELFRLGPDSEHVDLPVILRRIEEESTRMRRLVEDLLLLARLDETRPAEETPVDLAVLAADACSDAVAADPGRPVVLDAPEPVTVLADADHLRQALGNLMANAVRHTPRGTPIEVSAEVRGGRPVVTVRDHGPGLDEETRAHLFDRFWQADPARAGVGAGLGLSIVQAIAAEHDGGVAADNAPGGGAVFTLRLPSTRLVAAPAAEELEVR